MLEHPPSSRKRLLPDCCKPKTPTSPDPSPLKKTRDFPNLTECQACGSRIDNENGKNRIQTLYSEWRIVLLCPRCYHRVDSSQICTYCLKEASDGYCFSCGQCKRSLQKTCFLNYKYIPPWSYSVCGSEFTVCIDCWVPKQIAHKRGIFRRNRKAKNSSVSEARDGGVAKLLEDVVKESNCVEKKVEAAVKAREISVKKAAVANRAVELANNALEECDDAELAFRLHRTMNSSPRISKKRIFCDQNGLEPLIAGSGAFSHLKPTEIVYARHRKKHAEIVYARHRNKLNEMVYVQRGKNLHKFVYNRHKKQSESKEKSGVEIGMKEREVSCSSLLSNSSGVDSSMNFESKPYNYKDDSTVFKDTQSDGKLVQYLLTYSRKKSNWKETPNGKGKFLYGGYNLESQAISPQLPESLMISGNTLQPFLASAGARDSCQDHS
ncbi:hypothetical protein REPUB_Repub04eG0104100 [Reevesia pubescens]